MKGDFETALNNFLSVIWKDSIFTTSEDGAAVWFQDVDPLVKSVMFWYFIGSMRFIQEKFPRVFPCDEGDGGFVKKEHIRSFFLLPICLIGTYMLLLQCSIKQSSFTS